MWDNFVLLDRTVQNVNNFIRQHIQNNNLQQSEALFPINQWNVVNRLQNQISRTNNSIEAFFKYIFYIPTSKTSAKRLHEAGHQRKCAVDYSCRGF